METINTTNYFIAGYVVIFGAIFAYIFNLWFRTRNLKTEKMLLKDLESNKK